MDVLLAILVFFILSISSKQIGISLNQLKLPLISGFLFAGMLMGPSLLGIFPTDLLGSLKFIDDVSLAVIALAAGNELFLGDLKKSAKSIAWITVGQVLVIFGVGSILLYFLSGWIPFMKDMSSGARLGVSFLMASILIARSPSSAIAIVNELRAKGPFTQTTLGVTMVTDVVVIVLFSISFSVAGSFINKVSLDLFFLLYLLMGILLSMLLGWLLGKFFEFLFSLSIQVFIKVGSLVFIGYLVFLLSKMLSIWIHETYHISFHLEPLLICMIASFVITNFTKHRVFLHHSIEQISPVVYIAFFTYTGMSLQLDVLVKSWALALFLFFLRVVLIYLGALLGGSIAKDPRKFNHLTWMTFITQAGVGLGLAKQVSGAYSGWGESFTTLIISVIVLNQILGPPFFKWAIQLVGESHAKSNPAAFDGFHDAIFFGLDGKSHAVARSLVEHEWNVTIVTTEESALTEGESIQIVKVPDYSLESLKVLPLEKTDAIVCFLEDAKNYEIVEYVYETYGIENVVVEVSNLQDAEKFEQLGALTLHNETAMINVFDHLIRSPKGTSFLLGFDKEHDAVDLVVRDFNLHHVALGNLTLPLDISILSITRNGAFIEPQSYTLLEKGDKVSIMGSPESIQKVQLMFEV